ncbi:2059_t:CDS:2, partial [Gigaspora rosea]
MRPSIQQEIQFLFVTFSYLRLDDKTYMQNNVFTSEKLEKIRNAELKNLSEMAVELLKSLRYLSREKKRASDEDKSTYDYIASSRHKNKNRIIQGLIEIARKALMRKCDLVLKKGVYEYGASKVEKNYEAEIETNLLMERGLKSPKMPKDMLDTEKLRRLELVSFIHSDAPAGYICRVTRTDTLQIPTNMIIRRMIDVVERTNNDNNALEDLQNGSVHKLKDVFIVPNC